MEGLFAGLSTVDIQFMMNEFPEVNTKSVVRESNIYSGGPATNAAITYSNLGGRAALITSVGNHFFTEFINNDLATYNVKLYDVSLNANTSPIISSIITSRNTGSRTIVTVDPETNTGITGNNDKYLKDFCKRELKYYKIVLLDCFYIERAIVIAREAKKLSIPVVIDGGSWKNGMEKLLDFIDVAVCSEKFYPPGVKSTDEVFEYMSSGSCERIAITRGEKPILYKDRKEYNKISVTRINAVDTLGAGDVFHGAFCFYFLKGNNFTEALKNAASVATESCKHIGTRKWASKVK
ncbi:MAG: hypothetical protein JSV22_04660 [Bacteroidales bacterium]|nr:MAG: hypothetical protein JSV22_04660 [Bacteroidales bacterium]